MITYLITTHILICLFGIISAKVTKEPALFWILMIPGLNVFFVMLFSIGFMIETTQEPINNWLKK